MGLQLMEIASTSLPPLTAGDPRVSIPTFEDVMSARDVVGAFFPPTPIAHPEALSARLGFDLFLKCECLLPTGSFKVRGGLNFVSRMSESERARGVVTASTGNHGQSIAFAARAFGVRAVIYVPEGANPLKVQAIREYGAEVVFHGVDFDQCRLEAADRADRVGMLFIHASNERSLIAGVASYVVELMEQVPILTISSSQAVAAAVFPVLAWPVNT